MSEYSRLLRSLEPSLISALCSKKKLFTHLGTGLERINQANPKVLDYILQMMTYYPIETQCNFSSRQIQFLLSNVQILRLCN